MGKRSKKSESTMKRETVEEFLARGGQITKCPPAPTLEEIHSRTPAHSSGETLMSLAEGALYYSEARAKVKERKKAIKPINKDALPASLRKYMPKNDEDAN